MSLLIGFVLCFLGSLATVLFWSLKLLVEESALVSRLRMWAGDYQIWKSGSAGAQADGRVKITYQRDKRFLLEASSPSEDWTANATFYNDAQGVGNYQYTKYKGAAANWCGLYDIVLLPDERVEVSGKSAWDPAAPSFAYTLEKENEVPDLRLRTKILVLLVCLVGIGFWRGWFSVSRPRSDTESDKVNVNVSVDKGKIKSDVKKLKKKVEKEVRELEGKTKTDEAK